MIRRDPSELRECAINVLYGEKRANGVGGKSGVLTAGVMSDLWRVLLTEGNDRMDSTGWRKEKEQVKSQKSL